MINCEHFSEEDWEGINLPYAASLIRANPSLFEKIGKFKYELDVNTWISVLKQRPELIPECDLFKFSSYDMYIIMRNIPNLIEQKYVDQLSSRYKRLLFCYVPQSHNYIDINEFNITVDQWIDMLRINPKLISKCPYVDLLPKHFIELLYSRAPEETAQYYLYHQLTE